MLKKIVLTTALGTLTLAALAKPFPHHDGERAIFKQLDLSVSQKQDLRQIMREGRDDANVYHQDLKSLKDQMKALVTANEWDETAALALLQEQAPLMEALAMLKAERKVQAWEVLDENQQEAFLALADNREAEMGEGREWRRLSKLDLSAEQESAIAAIKADAEEHRQGARATRQALRDGVRGLIANNSFTADSFKALYAQYEDDILQAGLARAHTRHQVWNILTEEQQAEVAQKMEKRTKPFRKDRRS